MYGRGMIHVIFRRTRIYHGVGGFAPFQSLYERSPGVFGALPLMPEWYLLILIFTAILRFGSSLETAVSGSAPCTGRARLIFGAGDSRCARRILLHSSPSRNREDLAAMSHCVSSPAPAARATQRPPEFRSYRMAAARQARLRHAAAALLGRLDGKLAGSGGKTRTNQADPYMLKVRSCAMAAITSGGISRSLAACSEVSGC